MNTVKVPLDVESFSLICKALGHPARVKIVQHLLETDSCICGQIVEILPFAQSTVSQHLKILRQSGLVKGVVDGPRSCYCIDRHVFEAFKDMVKNFDGIV
jgi:DNA-binding transcriptional ArsR family regulator